MIEPRFLVALFACVLFLATAVNVSASYISHVPVKTVWGAPVGTFYLEGRYPGLECVVVSGDFFRDALLVRNGVDPYRDAVNAGFVTPYDIFCGYDDKMVGVGLSAGACYVNGT